MLLIDDRKGSADLVEYAPLYPLGELCRLDSGDVCFVGNGPEGPLMVGIEVKSVWDVLASSATGRLQATQITTMLDEYDVCWLLYYGEYRPASGTNHLRVKGERGKWRTATLGRDTPLPFSYIEKLLMDLAATGVRVKHVPDKQQAAMWIRFLYDWWSKPWDKHKGLRTFDNSRQVSLLPGMDDAMLRRARVASCLPGLGFEKAVVAAQRFGTIREMLEATQEDWMSIHGIGPTLSKGIVRAVNE